MITFVLSLVALIVGYMIYGRIVERVFAPDDRETPAVAKADGVDFIVLPSWKIFMIQFLNIAGTGPIFGAIMGAKFGPAAYLWIVLGCIFAGATHDYLSGMLSMRNGGAGQPELVGKYLGLTTKRIMLVFSVFLLMMVAAVFVYSPALIMGKLCSDDLMWVYIWCGIIFVYYIIATMLPIDKIIGRIYPLFAISMLFMAVALMAVLFIKWPSLPELYDGIYGEGFTTPIFPALFITIACGAISGFHATQTPLMARCVKNEKMGRPMFYGAMITEGLVALIWATVSMYFFYGGAAQELGLPTTLQAPEVVTEVSKGWLGTFGGILAMLGVVAAPITSGDTALRSARLIIAEFIHLEQKSFMNRIWICIPLFGITFLLLYFNIENPDGFNVIWSYFGWSNQTLAVFTLWAITVYLVREKKCFWITLLPALFMTVVCSSFLMVSPNAFNFEMNIGYIVGASALAVAVVWFLLWHRAEMKRLNK
ncbi:carbon starvation protein A [Prevotella sp. E13-27]|uniref:carbon starvation CstA family protein n=1 Tax=Prevotella sp. E13-27 TaxID=2938122 RepID=UPI00200A25D4|nr:carbon starvation CstA family protein [Prevotella sp. E13-27]MCK8623199.1 carbon starvation protein A [Prevotella sp. E13-27]